MSGVPIVYSIEPPDDLNDEQRSAWLEIVPPLAADGFPAQRESDLLEVLRSLVDSTIDMRAAEAAVERFGRFTETGRETGAARALKMARNRRQRDLLHVRQARKVRKRAPGAKPALQIRGDVAQLAAEIPPEQRRQLLEWMGYRCDDGPRDDEWAGILSGDAALEWIGLRFDDLGGGEGWIDPDDPEHGVVETDPPKLLAINDSRFDPLYTWIKERHPWGVATA